MTSSPRISHPQFLALATIAGVLAWIPPAVYGQDSVLAPTQQPLPANVNPSVMTEINSIRQMMGGGVAEQLKGILPDPELGLQLEADFEKALRQQASQLNPGLATPGPSNPNRVRSLNSGGPPPQSPPVASQVPKLIHHHHRLRAAARQLELIAADLEDGELYQEADSLREQARAFWLKSRENRKSNPLPVPKQVGRGVGR